MLNVEIRNMYKSDIHDVVTLISNTYEELNIYPEWRYDKIFDDVVYAFDENIINHVRPVFFVAIIENKIIGVASVCESHMSSHSYELAWGTVLPEYQRHGICTLLTLKRMKYVKSLVNYGIIMISAKYPELYRKLGFKELDYDGDKYKYLYHKF